MSALAVDRSYSDRYFRASGPQKSRVVRAFASSDLRPTLEKLVASSTNCYDRQRGLEILSSMDEHNQRSDRDNRLLMEYRLKRKLQRSKSAHAKFQGGPDLQRFSTTYNDFYPIREIKETVATRPCSTENIIIRPNNAEECKEDAKESINISKDINSEVSPKILSVYHQETTYSKDYCSADNMDDVRLKVKSQCAPRRAATASGSRCHNPHPNQAFLVWRYPREVHNKTARIPSQTILKANMDNKFANISDEQFSRVMRGNCRSTYQSDFVGGVYPEDRLTPFYIHPQINTGEKLKISTQRIDYNSPQPLTAELSVPIDRYKSNKTKNQSAQGIIPEAINKIYMNTHVRTTYDEDINDRAEVIHGHVMSDLQRKVDLNKLHNLKALERAMLNAKNIEDKEALDRIFQRLNEPEDYKRQSFVRKPFYKKNNPCWTSNWPGPL